MMTDKQPMQADGKPSGTSRRDGVEEATHGKSGGGESQGAAYPNPHRGKKPRNGPGDVMGHGGQTEIAYHGGPNPNATTKED
jgi:hypothetical protein